LQKNFLFSAKIASPLCKQPYSAKANHHPTLQKLPHCSSKITSQLWKKRLPTLQTLLPYSANVASLLCKNGLHFKNCLHTLQKLPPYYAKVPTLQNKSPPYWLPPYHDRQQSTTIDNDQQHDQQHNQQRSTTISNTIFNDRQRSTLRSTTIDND
jgi:hypothetical protein